MKNNDHNSIEKLALMSLIDPEFVEEAAYPEASQKVRRFSLNKWQKAAIAAAAVVAIAVSCVGFYSQIKAFADQFFNSATIFDDGNRMEGQMGIVPINQVSVSDLQKEYYTLDEVENLLGINLLQSPLASSTLYPCIHIDGWFNGEEVEVSTLAYYLHHCRTTPRHPNDIGSPVYTHADQNDAYIISYEASFLVKGESNGMQHSYENAQLVENYTTAKNLNATIFQFGSCYNAVIYHNNIRYEFEMTAHAGSSDINEFKAFLDTLSDK